VWFKTLSIKKPHQNPFPSFKDLSIHRVRQRKATLLYTMLLFSRVSKKWRDFVHIHVQLNNLTWFAMFLGGLFRGRFAAWWIRGRIFVWVWGSFMSISTTACFYKDRKNSIKLMLYIEWTVLDQHLWRLMKWNAKNNQLLRTQGNLWDSSCYDASSAKIFGVASDTLMILSLILSSFVFLILL
jgi:hypothetical protein